MECSSRNSMPRMKTIDGAFVSDEDKDKLKEAILECTREEVRRTLFELLGKQSKDATITLSTQQPAQTAAKTKRAKVKRGQNQADSQRKSSPHSHQQAPAGPSPTRLSVPLEIGVPKHTRLRRSTSIILEKGVDIVTKATGRRPTKFGLHEDDETDTKESGNKPASPESQFVASQDEGLHRVESWPAPSKPKYLVHFRPVETTRLLRTSPHSVTNVNMARPSTTALERRSWTSTAASERRKALQFGQRLLGPMTLESKLPNHSMVLPSSLQINEWENELARSIINVYSNKVRSDIKQCDDQVDYLPPGTASSSNNRISSVNAFFQTDNDSDGDFQRISISRGGRSFSCFDVGDNTVMERPDTALSPVTCYGIKSKRSWRISNGGAMRLRMVWLTGTAAASNWHVDDSEAVLDIDQEELLLLDSKGWFMKYIILVEAAIRKCSGLDAKQKLWRQLIMVSIGFATRSIEQKRWAKAMEILDKSQDLVDSDILIDSVRQDLAAATKEAQAYYYMRRAKFAAALQFVIAATNKYKTSTNQRYKFINIARCQLHQAFIQNKLNKHDKAIQSLQKNLSMIERGVLDIHSENRYQVLLLVSITYTNIAVQQLATGHVSDSCVSSQNARRLARLCLSASSPYLPAIEYTHKQALAQLSQMLQNSHQYEDNQKQNANLFHGLISELFD